MDTVLELLSSCFGDRLPADLPAYSTDSPAVAYAQHRENLEALLNREAASDLIPLLARQAWQVPSVGASDAAFAKETMFVQFYGPDGEVAYDSVRLGLFYMGPDFPYRPHHHEAHETYVRLAGDCTFILGPNQDRTETQREVINPPNQIHAMQAGPSGVLLAWLWSGDIRWETYAYD